MVGMVQVMLGSKGATLAQLAGGFFSASGASSGPATCNYDVASDGNEKGDKFGTYTTVGPWLLVGAAGDYEVRFTHQSGDMASGTFGTWLALSTTRGVSLSAGIGAVATSSLLVEIRQSSTGVVAASATITLESERF